MGKSTLRGGRSPAGAPRWRAPRRPRRRRRRRRGRARRRRRRTRPRGSPAGTLVENVGTEFNLDFSAISPNFRGLVLFCIEADSCTQIRILQHFSRSRRKSSYREQILQISAKTLQNIGRLFQKKKKKKQRKTYCKFFGHLSKICKFCNFSEIRNIFANFCRIFSRILQKFVDVEKC